MHVAPAGTFLYSSFALYGFDHYYSLSHIVQIMDFFCNLPMTTARKKFETFTECLNIKNIRSLIYSTCRTLRRTSKSFNNVIIVKSYISLLKGIKLEFICMKMKLMKNKKYK